MTKQWPLFALALAACGAESESLPLEAPSTLAGTLSVSEGSCLAWDDREMTVRPSQTFPLTGAFDDPDCVIAPTYAGPDYLFWVSGPSFDVGLLTPEYDDDPVPHSINAGEDQVIVGTFPLKIFARGPPAPWNIEGDDRLLLECELTITGVDFDARTVAIEVTY